MLNTNEILNETKDKTKIRSLAVCIETAPEASGRFFFVGCCLSSSISIRSLKMYIALARIENKINARSVSIFFAVLEKEKENSRGININKFFMY